MSSAVRQIVDLGAGPSPWPTLDPFLFCVHHNDSYPAGTTDLAPDASLGGRAIGQDFSNQDGWSMYHGRQVPGFPQHPHRGFETITFARQGLIDHADSLGATARFGRGDVQWMTAGRGIVHSEMFPLVNDDKPNPTELFQVWLNLPAADKMVDPYFTMLWNEKIPMVEAAGVQVTVLAGDFQGAVAPTPPPNSWASRPEAGLAIWYLRFDAGASVQLPVATADDVARTAYVFDGDHLTVDGTDVASRQAAVLDPARPTTLQASGAATECLILQGRPIGEPVEQYGPFVMNTRAEIQQAFDDYNATGFGGWPWPSDDPNHGRQQDRFAVHADGTEERP